MPAFILPIINAGIWPNMALSDPFPPDSAANIPRLTLSQSPLATVRTHAVSSAGTCAFAQGAVWNTCYLDNFHLSLRLNSNVIFL